MDQIFLFFYYNIFIKLIWAIEGWVIKVKKKKIPNVNNINFSKLNKGFCLNGRLHHSRFYPVFSPTRPSGPSWSSSHDVRLLLFMYLFVCPLPIRAAKSGYLLYPG